jgi:uncharacterized protein with NRDE domain
MCVVALAWNAHPRWRVVMAGNRDEFHARPSAPMARWGDATGIIAGRDLVGGGTWAGVSEAGRLAAIVNVRGGPPDQEKASRGGLVTGALEGAAFGDLATYNAFAILTIDGNSASLATNVPASSIHVLGPGVHSLSNGLPGEPWPRKAKVEAHLINWLASGEDPSALFTMLSDEAYCGDGHSPVFIRNPVYGTRASTVIAVDEDGHGVAIERSFGAEGSVLGEVTIPFAWPQHA